MTRLGCEKRAAGAKACGRNGPSGRRYGGTRLNSGVTLQQLPGSLHDWYVDHLSV
jgi:hypothetical protein